MTNNIFKNEAPKYWDTNLTVTPIPKGTKRGINKWQHFIDQVPSEANQKAWLENYAQDGIGLLAGKKVRDNKKLIAIDCDDDRYIDFIVRLFGPVVSGKKGKKGITLFVLAELNVEHTIINAGKNRIFDILVRKCCVLPPSLHPDTGKPYQWKGKPLYECDLEDLRTVSKEEIELLKAIISNPEHEALLLGAATHDPALSLTASLASKFDGDLIVRFLDALLPANYKGNLRKELLEMVCSAKDKGLGEKPIVDFSKYDPSDAGPIPLGFTDNGSYVFLHQDKNILSVLSPNQLMTIAGLCDLAPMPFWVASYPKYGANGHILGMDEKGIGNMLMEKCRKAGPFISSRVRGAGIWREGTRVIKNLRGPLPQSESLTYIRFESLPEFSAEREIDPVKLLKWMDHFNWSQDGLSMLLLGWTALAPICGVFEWRPHIFINGPKNTGKSTLIETLADLLHPMAIVLDGTSSEAGIRQSIGADSRPVVLDEFESDRNLGRMRNILKLARSASSAKGPIARGTPEGKAIQFQIFSTFCFGAIIPIPGSNADASRIVEIELKPHDNDRNVKAQIDEGRRYFQERKSSWPHQMIELIEPMLSSMQIFDKAMPSGDIRHHLNMATLLGAAFTVLNKRAATQEEAAAMVMKYEELIVDLSQVHETDEGKDCLNHLLCSKVGKHTVGDLITGRAFTPTPEGGIDIGSGDSSKNLLAGMGILMEGEGFLVANRHPELNQIYKDTLWADGAWKTPLRRLDGAIANEQTRRRFSGGSLSRATFVPLAVLQDE